MSDEPSKPGAAPAPAQPRLPTEPTAATPWANATEATDSGTGAMPEAERADRSERSITDFVRRAVSAGVVAAGRSKDDIMRAAAGEVRGWLEHLNLSDEIAKALSKTIIEVKTEIRFRTTEDGKVVSESSNDVKLKAPR